jgi:hypothetical protein
VTAIAADQSPGCPRFIALPPGSVGSDILDEFPEVANAAKVLPPSSHGVEHFISTNRPPIASKFRWLDAEKIQAANEEFEQLEREGIVQPSTSPWASPLHMLMKKDGTAICTPFGLFEFHRMPFGLRNAGNTFQRMMDHILAGLCFVFCYLDNIIIASKDEQEHLEHLREVFSRLCDAGLVINAEKCVFAEATVKFLGHKVLAAGVEPLRSHVQAVLTHPEPTNISELQAFLGRVNFYHRFLPAAARILKPLTDLLIGGHKGTEPVSLADPQRAALVAAKDALAAATCLAHPSQGGQRTLGSPSVFSPGSWTAPR